MKKFTLIAEYTTTCFTHIEAESLTDAISLASKRPLVGHPRQGMGDPDVGWATEASSVPEDASIRPCDMIDAHGATMIEFDDAIEYFNETKA